MGDDDHGLSVLLHIPHDLKKPLGLLGGEHGGGLVQNQDAGAPIQHLDDLYGLLLGDGHLVNLLVGVDGKAVAPADLLDPFVDGPPVQAGAAGQAQYDVLRRGKHVYQLEMLVNHADAAGKGVLGVPDGDLPPIHQNLSLVRIVDAGNHIHEGGLAAAVFSQQGENLAAVQGQADVVVGDDSAEPLGDVPELNGRKLGFCVFFSLQAGHPFCR